MASASDFSILTTLRWDPHQQGNEPFYLLPEHRVRLLHSAQYFHTAGDAVQGFGAWDLTIALLEDQLQFEKAVTKGLPAIDLEQPLRVGIS